MHFSLPFFNTDIAFSKQLAFPYCRAQQTRARGILSSFGNKTKRAKTWIKANSAFYFWCQCWFCRKSGKQYTQCDPLFRGTKYNMKKRGLLRLSNHTKKPVHWLNKSVDNLTSYVSPISPCFQKSNVYWKVTYCISLTDCLCSHEFLRICDQYRLLKYLWHYGKSWKELIPNQRRVKMRQSSWALRRCDHLLPTML